MKAMKSNNWPPVGGFDNINVSVLAASECEDGWTSHVYTSGATLEGFRISHLGVITFGSSASVLSRGGRYRYISHKTVCGVPMSVLNADDGMCLFRLVKGLILYIKKNT